DTEGLITSINSGAIRLLGVGEEYVGLPLSRIATEEVPIDELGRRVAERSGHVRDQEYTLHRDGQTLRLLAMAHELKDPGGRTLGCVIHVRDVTERMRMKEQVWRLERLAGLSTLAAGLHHEIKNPLTA